MFIFLSDIYDGDVQDVLQFPASPESALMMLNCLTTKI